MPDSPTPPPIRGRVPVASVPEPVRTVRGPWAPAAPHQAERRAADVNWPLPPAPLPAAPEPPPPPAPSESDLRDLLADALHRQKLTADIAERAAAAHARAAQHQQDCQSKVAEFADLDVEISDAVTGALRDGNNPEAVRDNFKERVNARAEAQAALADAASAVATLLAERSAAAGNASSVNQEVNLLAARVLTFSAEKLVTEIEALQAEINARRRTLLGFDRFVTGHKAPLPPSVRSLLGAVGAREISHADLGPWREAQRMLLADPLAPVEIPLPTPPAAAPMPVQPPVPVMVTPMDDGDPHLIPAVEES